MKCKAILEDKGITKIGAHVKRKSSRDPFIY